MTERLCPLREGSGPLRVLKRCANDRPQVGDESQRPQPFANLDRKGQLDRQVAVLEDLDEQVDGQQRKGTGVLELRHRGADTHGGAGGRRACAPL